jgi:YVTN family beta-propeller protein
MPRTRATVKLSICALVALTLDLSGAAALSTVVGPQPDGTGVTPEGWRVTPAGTQTRLGNDPLDLAISPDGTLAVVANAGYQNHSLMVVDTATGAVKETIPALNNSVRAGPSTNDTAPGGPTHFYFAGGVNGYYVGLAFSPDGSTAYASDGPGSGIHTFAVAGGTLSEKQEIGLPSGAWPAGIAGSADGTRLYVAADLADSLLVVDPAKRKVLSSIPVGHLPYGVALDHTGQHVYVSNWGGNTVSVLSTASGTSLGALATGLHPCAMALNPTNSELFVANSDSDTVTVIDTAKNAVLRTIDLRPYAGAPIGTSPDAVSVSADGGTLYVANAGNNDVSVVKLGAPGSTSGLDRVEGLIPTGWYPAGVAVRSNMLFVVNMYGLGVGSVAPGQYIASMVQGTLSRIPVPTSTQLAADTAQVNANDRFSSLPSGVKGNPVPATVGAPSPIKHVIYVMKENRTFDQVLGDLGKGNGDPSLEMFPYSVTPNQHTLASRFVTLDNFYTDGAVSADGWSWSTEAGANTYNDKNWPPDYGTYGRPYDFGGFNNNETAALMGTPTSSFLWDRLAQAGVSYRNYGFFMDKAPVQIPTSMPNLVGQTDLNYTGWNLKYDDQLRMDEWMREFASYKASGSLPTMQFVYLPQDHTMVTATQQPQPSSMIADNDLALGRLVDAVSHSQFWASTAIFVVEDDAQDGPDHVSGHRTIAQVISPYTQTGAVDSTLYSTASMLRTMELILGLQPMTQFDAAATPMYASFQTNPNLRAYTALVPQQSLTALNPASAPMAAYFAAADWSRPDAVPEQIMNAGLEAATR